MSDLVGEKRAAGAAGRRPAVDTGSEHEMVEEELAAAIEQIGKTRLAVRALEHIGFVDPRHRLSATFGGQGVAGTGGCLFLCQQLVVGRLPFGRRHDLRKRRLGLRCHDRFALHLSCAAPGTAAPGINPRTNGAVASRQGWEIIFKEPCQTRRWDARARPSAAPSITGQGTAKKSGGLAVLEDTVEVEANMRCF